MNSEVQSEQQLNEDSDLVVVDPVADESVIVVNCSEAENFSGEEDEGNEKVSLDKLKTNVCQSDKHECVIDVKCNCGENPDANDKVCRICYLSADPQSKSSDLIQLGCSCKDELGVAHPLCAQAWFKLKGNRCCEICGEVAKNISGVDTRLMEEEWNERVGDSSASSSERRLWRGQPLCNFLMACLIVGFILPWFFRVNIF